jgi:DNA-binding response OmpR family regulator
LQAKILVVDDEPPIVEMLSYNLRQANYSVVVASDGEQALVKARLEQPDLIILDLMLPIIDGLEVCKIIRKERDIPIIMLTARDDEIDRVVGLELGADDYVVKPFSVRELLVRVKNVLRRMSAQPSTQSARRIEVGDLIIDEIRREVTLYTIQIKLTSLEFELLNTLSQHAGQVLSREQLITKVWGYDYLGDVRVVDAVVKRLRAKIREISPDHELIETVRGIGYRLPDPF